MPSEDKFKEIVEKLLEWFNGNGRKFPWRTVNDPYVILVTEFLLQRTKAEVVERTYYEFFSKYPTIESLAYSNTTDLRKFFSNLGLLYRGERLKMIAEEILEKYGGTIPCEMEALLKLRGVGVYIASAVLNFGCDVPTPVVDKNVLRVLNRLGGIVRETVARHVILKLYRYGNNRKIAYALIDIGAITCLENPRCAACPLDDICPKFPLQKSEWRMLRKIVKKDGSTELREQPVVRKKSYRT